MKGWPVDLERAISLSINRRIFWAAVVIAAAAAFASRAATIKVVPEGDNEKS
jgi:hypothetical protein